MTSKEILFLTLPFAGGFSLGVLFFAGLWWTVRKGMVLKSPAPLFLGSFLLRTITVLVGFYFIINVNWQSMTLYFIGFIVGRITVNRYVKKHDEIKSVKF